MSGTVTVLTDAAAKSADANLQTQITAQAARLAALEGGAPPPTQVTESPDKFSTTLLGVPVTVLGVVWRMVPSTTKGYQCQRHEAVRTETGNVAEIYRLKDAFWQRNTAGGHYTIDAAGAAWSGPHLDPRIAIPPSVTDPSVPAPAAAVGYNTRTFGPEILIGQNWVKTASDNVTQRGTGVVCAGGSNGWNGHLKSKTIFSKGGYFEAALSWTGEYNGWGMSGSTGWPSWWANSAESDAGQINYSAEPDFMEYWGKTRYGGAIHAWYPGSKLTIGTNYDGPSGFDPSQVHRYGTLWVPATAAARGYAKWYLDRVHLPALDISWGVFDPARPLPPIDVSVIDRGHQGLILGSGAGNPMSVVEAGVWQRDASGNATR